MALYIYQPGIQPVGNIDLIDGYALKGGELGTLFQAPRTNSLSEKAAADVLDGYNYAMTRTGIAPSILSSSVRPLWLLDEGIAGYGTLFGSVIGTVAGLGAGSVLGPATYAGSGKATAWDKPGVYAISLDAVDQTAQTGITMTNASMLPGVALKPMADGVLTQNTSPVNVTVARFMDFETSPSLVTTPASLVGATEVAVRVVISYNVE